MGKSFFSISIFFALFCLWSPNAVFGREIPTEENGPRLENDQLSAPVDQDLATRIENLEEKQKALIKIDLEQRQEISTQNETLEKLTGALSSVQNELESKAGKNETEILEKELKDIRREFEELKASESKFSSLRNNIPHTTTCGGFITLKKEHEIRYQVPSQQNGNESEPKFCIWIVKNFQPQNLVLELTEVERGQDFQLWTISSSTNDPSSTKQKIQEKDTQYLISDLYFALYFRINPSTVNSNSNLVINFKLNIKSNIFSPVVEVDFKNIEITASSSSSSNSTSSSESFSYPLPPSTQYSNNERTFIILKPTEAGSSLWLKIKSLQTEINADYIEIVTFSGRPISRARLSGNVTTERTFRSGADEPMMVFFRSDSSEQRSGFSFDYAEENKETVGSTTQNQKTCGGFVPVDFEGEISYQVPSNASSSVCIWVVKNELAGGLQVQLADQNRWANHESTELFIIHSIEANSSQKLPINIQDPSVSFSSDVGSYFLLYFRFNPNLEAQNQKNSSPQGFRLLLQDNSEDLTVKEELVSWTELMPSSTPTEQKEFSYPVGATEYLNYERAFIIIKPTAVGSKIKIDMTAIDTEENYDTVQIMSYSEEEKEMSIDFSFSGTFNETSPRTLKGRENEPVIIYFSSDSSGAKSGFRCTYSEVRTNAVS